jgi:hypothetical protein
MTKKYTYVCTYTRPKLHLLRNYLTPSKNFKWLYLFSHNISNCTLHSRYTYGGVDLRARRSANEELHDLAINNADHGHQAHPELHEGKLKYFEKKV